MPEYFKGNDCIVTTQVEATYGAFAVGSAADQVYLGGMSLQHGSRVDEAPPALGVGQIFSKDENAEWCDANLDLLPFMYGLYDWLWVDLFREDAMPSATDYTDEFTIDPVGTHIDGSTGCTIVLGATASASDLANWNTYNGATLNGAAGMMMEMSGWAEAANNVPAAIKAVNASQIDIDGPYSTTGVSTGMGALKEAETDIAGVTLKIGQGIRVLGSAGYRSRSFEIDTETATVPFLGASGQVLNTLAFAAAGNGYASLGPAAFVGQNYSPDAAATRYSGTINEDTDIEKIPLGGGGNLSYCAVNGANHFAGNTLTNVSATMTQNATPPSDIGGRPTRPIVRPGPFNVTAGQLSYTEDPGTLTAALQTIQAAKTRVPIDLKLSNGTNFVWIRFPKCAISFNERPVGPDYVTGGINFHPMAANQDIGMAIYQSFAS